ncbi:FAD-dependent oxidoreductase [Streptomyces sp. R39]|uniref:FAD-dependent oxidoreductase n=1 Tax=Streptomyces sp. R39 TaxID=3238631 RepID=A0AB39R1D7_9ACTN
MMDTPSRPRAVLVVGGGTAGNAVTVLLRRAGLAVDLIEARPDWNATTGSGITLQGNALRVLRELGVWEEVKASGAAFDAFAVTAPDGTLLNLVQDYRTGGDDLPATLGMQRPRLQQILIDAVRESGAAIRLGTTVETLEQGAYGVSVRFSDGTAGHYDLVIGADGLNSATRAMIGIGDKPEPTGMAAWRVSAPRAGGMDHTTTAYGGATYIAGYTPTGPTTVYAFLVERCRDRNSLPPASYADEMRGLMKGYGGAWPEIARHVLDPAKVNYTWFHRLLIEGPWHRGRVVLIGDAVHCCPPTLAQGAAMTLEDASVLTELLIIGKNWDDDLLQTFHERRVPRVRTVVETSVQLGQWQLDGVRDADVPGTLTRTMKILAELP